MHPWLSALVFTTVLAAAGPPEAAISNGLIDAKLFLPDALNGYYRGTRFDWSGQVSSLKYKGHEYFGRWFERYDPKLHDAIMGPVEEFRTGDAGLGYAEAKVGEPFIRIGVGVVKKPEERAYRAFNTYEILDNGKWSIKKRKDTVEFTQALNGPNGYAYVYRKTLRLAKGKPVMLIEHSLRNTGKKAIETSQYNHNFFVMDQSPTGPDSSVQFGFDAKAKADLKGMAEVRGRKLTYKKELAQGESVFTQLEGFGSGAADYDLRLENRKAGTGVHIKGDQPIDKFVYWSIKTTFCPEPYIHFTVPVGGEKKWTYTYEFYTLQ